jgi:hypothetical protein
MDGMNLGLALLFSRAATIREAHSAFPDAAGVEPRPTLRDRLRARSAARAGRRAVRSAEQVVRAARPAARSATPTAGSPQPVGTHPTDPTGWWW